MTTRSVKLVTEHTINGVKYNPGQIVQMEAADAEWYAKAVVKQREDTQAAIVTSPAGVLIKDVVATGGVLEKEEVYDKGADPLRK